MFFFRKFFSIAWPISLQQIMITLLSVVDILMIGHLSNEAIAGVGLGNRIQLFFSVIILGLVGAVGILSSQYIGAKKYEKLSKIVVMGLLLSWGFLFPSCTFLIFNSSDILSFLFDDVTLVSHISNYLRFTLPSLFFLSFIAAIENTMRANHQVKLPLVFSALSIFLNIILNYWLINGGMGIAPLGVEGAAIATLLARMFHAFVILYYLNLVQHFCLPKLKDFLSIINYPHWGGFLKVALPMAASFGLWAAGNLTYHLIYGILGTEALAIVSFFLPIESMLIALFFGLSSACNIMVGNHLGASNFKQAYDYAFKFIFCACFGAIFIGVLLYVFQSILLESIYPDGLNFSNVVPSIFSIVSLLVWVRVLNMTLGFGILHSGGDNKFCMIGDFVGMWLIGIPTMYFVAISGYSLFIVVLFSYLEEFVKVFIFGLRFLSKRWLRNLTLANQ
ncbi:MATE family efflux transporter [Agarilytica rhodophyticola]|uniref:MATE family efflux transporter n=1 Tax=Agarilytica rhodophyticola TaxID=1737490 RepID=UPI000B345636|nr:MATE family efflux transporter [Agarilytica rhodophyticola]